LIATVLELLIQIIVHSRTGSPESSKVFSPNGGSNKLDIPVEVAVGELVPVREGVTVVVDVLVDVPVAVSVGVGVGVSVGIFVGVLVGVLVAVFVGVSVDVVVGVLVRVSVEVGVFVGVLVGVLVAVLVGVSVGVFVGVLVGVRTLMDAVAVFPVPPLVDVTGLVMLFFIPAVVPVTVTLKEQLAPAANDAPLRATVSGVVTVSVPPHCVEDALVTVKPAGSVSVKATPFSPVPAFGFVIVKLNGVVPLKGMLAPLKFLAMDGGAMTTSVSVAGSLLVAP
jgi:hypothetical protein